jgi:hypothetical protein
MRGNSIEIDREGCSSEGDLKKKTMSFKIPLVSALVITVVIPAPGISIAKAAELWRPMATEIARSSLNGKRE